MSSTMTYKMNYPMEQRMAEKGNGPDKQKRRPSALTISPFDATELERRLSVVRAERGDNSVESSQTEPAQQQQLLSPTYQLKKEASNGHNNSASPRTVVAAEPSPKGRSPKPRKDSTTVETAPPRRGSIFDRFSFKGSNLTEKDEEPAPTAPAAPAYRHVPRSAAASFARTTTVATVSQKAQTVAKTSPTGHGPNSAGNAPYEQNKAYRRAQSLCSGRPFDRNNAQFHLTVLETTAEVDEEPTKPKARHSLQGQTWTRFDGLDNNGRRMSTGNMNGSKARGSDMSNGMPPFRRDSNGMAGQKRRGSTSSNSNPFRRDSDASTPGRRDSSIPASPFRQDFDNASRRGSENAPTSRRPSVVAMGERRSVDWSQSDEPVKHSAVGAAKADSKWSLRGRLGSVSKQGRDTREVLLLSDEEADPPVLSKSPKNSFMSRFKR
ncbi:hypothetical protein G7046_g1416 [Stylonectria norvegica]|nr:hypothetical protein G7046_g1416 [Stylonectria norvegica]